MEVRAAAPEPSSSTRPTGAVQAAELATHRGRRGPPSSPPAEAPMGPPLGPPRASAPIMAAAAELRAPCSTSWRSPSRSGCRRSGSGVGLADAMSTRSASTAASTKRAAVVEQQGRGAVGGLAQLPREGAVLGQHRGEPLLDGRRGRRRRRERVDDGHLHLVRHPVEDGQRDVLARRRGRAGIVGGPHELGAHHLDLHCRRRAS